MDRAELDAVAYLYPEVGTVAETSGAVAMAAILENVVDISAEGTTVG